MREKKRDLSEEWLKLHDPDYGSFGNGGKKKDGYMYLTRSQLARRRKREVQYRDDLVNRTA